MGLISNFEEVRIIGTTRNWRLGALTTMKAEIHPKYHTVEATCVCGNVILTGSTRAVIKMDICSACHPFYTGTQKIIDTEGRVEKFNKRFANAEVYVKPEKKNKKGKEVAAPVAEAPKAPKEPKPEAPVAEAPAVEETPVAVEAPAETAPEAAVEATTEASPEAAAE
jgi:large subunit ribosomal protein L31